MQNPLLFRAGRIKRCDAADCLIQNLKGQGKARRWPNVQSAKASGRWIAKVSPFRQPGGPHGVHGFASPFRNGFALIEDKEA